MTDKLCLEWRKDKERATKERKGDRLERRVLIIAILLLSGITVSGVSI